MIGSILVKSAYLASLYPVWALAELVEADPLRVPAIFENGWGDDILIVLGVMHMSKELGGNEVDKIAHPTTLF